jgi:hypothetical protein
MPLVSGTSNLMRLRKFGFKENEEDNCIYTKFNNGKVVFLIRG